MKSRHPRCCARRRDAAFSLVEIALALGIVGFALVGIVGSLPLAMGNARLSIAQSRAASVAQTIFASFRAQPFNVVSYLDDGSATVNLDTRTPASTSDTSDALIFYAYFDEVPSADSTSDARRLHFVTAAPASAAVYHVLLRFSTDVGSAGTPTPLSGMLAPYTPAPNAAIHAQGSFIEASVYELDRPKDVFRFSSVIANRGESTN